MSWAPEVAVEDSGTWYRNSLRFATAEEALLSAKDLMSRWTIATDYRSTSAGEPVNHRWDQTLGLVEIDKPIKA